MRRCAAMPQMERSSLGRALTLLDAFHATDSELTLGELAVRTSMPKSTVHRLVGDLVAWGGLERTEQGLRLGLRLFELGHMVPAQRKLRDLALPHLEDLQEITGKTVNLAVRDGHDIVYVEKIAPRDVLIPHSRTGGRLPLHCTALGKAILAFSGPAAIEEVLSRGLRAVAPRTITDPDKFRRELSNVHRRRVAFDIEESQAGVSCTASPIVTSTGEAIAAISVTDMESAAMARGIGPAVLAAAMSLSRQIKR